jgi:hypothetical protein
MLGANALEILGSSLCPFHKAEVCITLIRFSFNGRKKKDVNTLRCEVFTAVNILVLRCDAL